MITIRKVDTFHDEDAAEDIRFLDSICFVPGDAPLVLPEAWWWVALDSLKAPVGFGGVKPSSSSYYGYLCRSGVAPGHRGAGIQKKLIKARIRFAKARGWIGLITDTSYDNYASANSLISCGFKLFKPTTPWAFSNSNYWRLRW
jgi:GNAT superfamily N-acetyltransferase